MRVKNKSNVTGFGVADGLDFGISDNTAAKDTLKTKTGNPASVQTMEEEPAPVRNYSKYYTPRPKKGSRGGTLGRGAIDEKERKIQFSLTCTLAQKECFMEAAQKVQRRLPEFICIAVEEYIKNNNLL